MKYRLAHLHSTRLTPPSAHPYLSTRTPNCHPYAKRRDLFNLEIEYVIALILKLTIQN